MDIIILMAITFNFSLMSFIYLEFIKGKFEI